MAKKKTYHSKRKLKWVDVFKGKFLDSEEIKENRYFIALIFFLLMMIVYSNDLVNQKIGKINRLKQQVEEYKSQNAYTQSKLIKIRLESELIKEVERDSLKALETHPMKILVKLDSTDYGKNK